MAGKRQKPPELLQGHRAHGTSTVLPKLGPDVRKVPAAPRGLHPEARKAWLAYWRSSVSWVVDLDADGPSIRRWAICLSEREKLTAKVQETPFVGGSMGQPVINPLVTLIQQYAKEIARLEEHFGMTPLAQMRLGIAITEAKRGVLDLNRSLDANEDDDVLLASVIGGVA